MSLTNENGCAGPGPSGAASGRSRHLGTKHSFLDSDKPKVMAKSRTQVGLLPVGQRFGLRLPEASPAVRPPAGIAPSSREGLGDWKEKAVDCERDSSKTWD